MMQQTATGRSYLPILALVLLFGLPPIAGWFYIMNPQWLPDKHKNRGTLILPPRPLQSLTLKDAAQQDFDWRALSGRWTLISYREGACDTGCMQQLLALGQVRRALGADRIRVGQLLIQTSPTARGSDDEPQQLVDASRTLYLPPQQVARFRQLFSLPGIEQRGATYLVDPNGMLMMGYPSGSPKKDILKDLETLLKASRSWTTGANNGYR
ncbi:SCO family protein [Sedimenticola thiotaurini]|uniref:Thioredoxin domain-containing protein n=1 Tax=Sedimenticola thiotaurini TaxID=1543721 RepID=A0A0F7JUN2_9GAMM|nr:hypothetical protein [Sedimenticola thiotaurini]AKH19287.1 hypothetical protein AAY24_01810 [Sedimenticola thiotaurini]